MSLSEFLPQFKLSSFIRTCVIRTLSTQSSSLLTIINKLLAAVAHALTLTFDLYSRPNFEQEYSEQVSERANIYSHVFLRLNSQRPPHWFVVVVENTKLFSFFFLFPFCTLHKFFWPNQNLIGRTHLIERHYWICVLLLDFLTIQQNNSGIDSLTIAA